MLVVATNSGHCRLLDMDGKPCVSKQNINGFVNELAHSIGSGRVADVCNGAQYTLGSKEIEIDRSVPRADYLSGACFGRAPAISFSVAKSSTSSTLARKFVPLKVMNVNHPVAKTSSGASGSKITLEPVNLVSTPDTTASQVVTLKSTGTDTYWTANWQVSSIHISFICLRAWFT